MKPFLTDVPVALIFFNRPDCFEKVFQAVAKARPSKLFLIQDGARPNKKGEQEKVLECRKYINIDWECEVHEDYSEENLGCGLRIYTGVSKAFESVDRLVIIEDDIVIGEDMLPFCSEMLEKYKNDERIGLISGMNHLWEYKRCPNSYFFSSRGGAIWGWATWKRVWDLVDWDLTCAEDDYVMNTLANMTLPQIDGKELATRTINKYNSMKRGERQTSWSTQFIVSSCILQSRLYIVPSKNLTSNIGLVGEHANHSGLNIVPRGLRKVYYAPTFALERPLRHPKYVIDDSIYYTLQRKVMTGGSFWGKVYRRLETNLYKLIPSLGK